MVGATKSTLSLVVNYMKYRNSHQFGYVKYYYFKRIIGYILDYHNDYFIRKIFLQLVDDNHFIKEKNQKQSYLYKFNNLPEPKLKKQPYSASRFIINFD